MSQEEMKARAEAEVAQYAAVKTRFVVARAQAARIHTRNHRLTDEGRAYWLLLAEGFERLAQSRV